MPDISSLAVSIGDSVAVGRKEDLKNPLWESVKDKKIRKQITQRQSTVSANRV